MEVATCDRGSVQGPCSKGNVKILERALSVLDASWGRFTCTAQIIGGGLPHRSGEVYRTTCPDVSALLRAAPRHPDTDPCRMEMSRIAGVTLPYSYELVPRGIEIPL